MDRGLGIPAEAREHLFERFYRVPGAERRAIQGTGLGLAIVKDIVEAHGGDVGVESGGAGQGSRFWFTLPLPAQRPLASSDTGVRSAARVPLTPAAPNVALRVLAIDDDPAVGNMVRRVLRADRHTVLTATSGQEAVDLLRGQDIDVVLTDLHLGGTMNGLQLVAELRKIQPNIRVVLASGALGIDREEAVTRGIDELLPKPYRPEDLRHLLARILSERHAQTAA
jgi:CheY-like chemotaxis protein